MHNRSFLGEDSRRVQRWMENALLFASIAVFVAFWAVAGTMIARMIQ